MSLTRAAFLELTPAEQEWWLAVERRRELELDHLRDALGDVQTFDKLAALIALMVASIN